MSGFKDTVKEDISRVFLNLNDFAENHIVVYDGTRYGGIDGAGIPILLTKAKGLDREKYEKDHAQGIYRVTAVLHCSIIDLDGEIPEKGQRIQIGDKSFLYEYYVASSKCDGGMLRVELEAIDE